MFKPGQSGNPSGRPKDTLGNFLRTKKHLPKQIYDAVYPLLKSKKEATRIWAAEFLRDSRDGKPTQAMELAGKDGGPLQVESLNLSTVSIDTLKKLAESLDGK